MRIPSGKTDVLIYFVAVDSTDLKTREAGLSSFTVYRSRNGGAATAYTTPTVAELSAGNMPGVYALTIDEDTTIAATSDSEEYCVHITQASMAPVTRVIELYRRDTTSGQSITVANGAADADIERIQGTVVSTPATAGILDVNVKNIDNDAASASGTVTFPNATLASTTNITAAAGCAVSSLGAGVITAASIAADAITDAKVAADVTIASVTGAVGSVTGSVGSVVGAVGSVTGNVGGSVASVVGAVGSVTGLTAANLDATVSSRLSSAGYTAPPSAASNATAVRSELTVELARIDAASSTLATAANLSTVAGYLDTEIAAILTDTGTTLDAALAVVDANVDAIKAKTDSLTFTVAGIVDANLQRVNEVALTGTGAVGDEFTV